MEPSATGVGDLSPQNYSRARQKCVGVVLCTRYGDYYYYYYVGGAQDLVQHGARHFIFAHRFSPSAGIRPQEKVGRKSDLGRCAGPGGSVTGKRKKKFMRTQCN